jgi:hypothetical protein
MKDFPNSPTNGQVFESWRYDGVKWGPASSAGSSGNDPITLSGAVSGTGTTAIVTTLATVPVASGGTAATTPGAALTNLGALPAAGGTMTGGLHVVSSAYIDIQVSGNSNSTVLALGHQTGATYIAATGATNLNLQTNGATRLTIDSSGHVTVPGPSSLLDVFDDGNSHIESSTTLHLNVNQAKPVNIGGSTTITGSSLNVLVLYSPNSTTNCNHIYAVPSIRTFSVGVNTLGEFSFYDNTLPGNRLVLQPSGANLVTNGTWAALSDERVKREIADYPHGLDQILALNPVVWTYAGSPFNTDGEEGFGLLASEVEAHLPELVGEYLHDPARLPDEEPREGEPTTFKTLDHNRLVFALINSVKTLAGRLEVLERRVKG